MGSEMCIRDRHDILFFVRHESNGNQWGLTPFTFCMREGATGCGSCLLYTSDAADERSSVDLGGRRIIKKKNKRDTRRDERRIIGICEKGVE